MNQDNKDIPQPTVPPSSGEREVTGIGSPHIKPDINPEQRRTFLPDDSPRPNKPQPRPT